MYGPEKRLLRLLSKESDNEVAKIQSEVEAEIQLSDTKVYRDVSNIETILSKLSETSFRMFSGLKWTGFLTEKQIKYFTYEFKKATNFGKLYLLPYIRKRLHNFPGTRVTYNRGSPTESVLSFLTII